MDKHQDMSEFVKDQIVMASHSISSAVAHVGYSQSAAVRTYQNWSREGKPVNQHRGHVQPRLTVAFGHRRLPYVF